MPEPTLPTQKFVDVREIKDGVVYLKSGGLRHLLMISGVNFDLKSETEQAAILGAFQGFLNTLDFSVQFFIHSRKANISAYLGKMRERMEGEENELLKVQIAEYTEFIRSFVEENPIITKTFFAIVPYDPVQISVGGGGPFGFLKKHSASRETAEALEKKEEHLTQLRERSDQVIAGLGQIGLRALPLGDEELLELFYNLYNPQLMEKKGLQLTKTK